jgi:exodeoxyribonuclease VII large subunit
VLARGFALVKGADGGFKRRAAAIKPGEALTLTFADGEAKAVAGGKPEPKSARDAPKKPGQGDLF